MFLIDVSADSSLTEVTLSKEQTLALFGQTLSASYKTDSGWASFPLTFDGFVEDATFSYYTNEGVSGYFLSYINSSTFLRYVSHDPFPTGTSGNQHSNVYIDCPFSINLSHIQLFHTAVLPSANSLAYPNSSSRPIYVSLVSTFSASPVINDFYHGANSNYLYGRMASVQYSGRVGTYACSDVIVNSQSTDTNFDVSDMQVLFYPFGAIVNPDYDTTTGGGTNAFYELLIACPTLTSEYVLPEVSTTAPDIGQQIGDIIISQSEINANLALILAKLDAIYQQNFNLDVNISSSSQSSLINGIKNLFIPSQNDLVSFRLNLMQELHSAFPAFFTAEDSIYDVFDIFHSVSPVSTVRFPGVSVDFPSGVGTDTVAFSLPAQDVELKPEAQRFSVLYDALALILDIVCTFAVFNMVKSKFHKIFEGSAAD